MSSGPVEIVVGTEDAGARVDVVLVRHVPGMSRARARDLADEGKIRVDGRIVPKGRLVAEGEHGAIADAPPPGVAAAEADPDLPLVVLHEDAHLVVVDKAAGVPSHPLRAHERGTVAGALLARYPEMAGVGYSPREPGLVHRLDTGTSGVLLAARDAATFEALRDALRAGEIDKRYLALAEGRVAAPDVVRMPLATDPRDERRVVACATPNEAERLGARPAVTEILASEPRGAFSLVTASAPAARRHQIRAHLAAIGHPLAGDTLYRGLPVEGLARHFLHAASLALRHPVTGAALSVDAPLPSDLAAVLARIG
jgi:23S rRNA pseudouridine1911/1915/1917 synthase